MLQKHGPRYDLTLIANQVFENLEFTRQEFDLATGAARRAGDQVKFQITDT